jgi:predicted amidohydrolase
MICFDWIFPEAARTLALQGAQVIVQPSNLVLPYCQKTMVSRSIENRVFTVTANRVGREKRGSDDFTFTGGSQITSFNGDVLSTAPADKPFAAVVEIEPVKALSKKINDFNDLFKDRRPEFYSLK